MIGLKQAAASGSAQCLVIAEDRRRMRRRHTLSSDAAMTHTLQKTHVPTKCSQCGAYTFFQTLQCLEVSITAQLSGGTLPFRIYRRIELDRYRGPIPRSNVAMTILLFSVWSQPLWCTTIAQQNRTIRPCISLLGCSATDSKTGSVPRLSKFYQQLFASIMCIGFFDKIQ